MNSATIIGHSNRWYCVSRRKIYAVTTQQEIIDKIKQEGYDRVNACAISVNQYIQPWEILKFLYTHKEDLDARIFCTLDFLDIDPKGLALVIEEGNVSPSHGGPRKMEFEDFFYALILESLQSKPRQDLLLFAKKHLAWRPLHFFDIVDDEMLAYFLGILGDPRWNLVRRLDRTSFWEHYFFWKSLLTATPEPITLLYFQDPLAVSCVKSWFSYPLLCASFLEPTESYFMYKLLSFYLKYMDKGSKSRDIIIKGLYKISNLFLNQVRDIWLWLLERDRYPDFKRPPVPREMSQDFLTYLESECVSATPKTT